MFKWKEISICVVDDTRTVVEGLKAMDWQAEGIRFAGTAANGEDGLELIKEQKPDIVITDIRMPRMDGLTMLRSILELQHTCKVILISGYTDFEYAKEAVQLGAFDFVVKPFTEEEILGTVRRAKEQIEAERSRLLSVQEMERKLRESIPLLQQEYLGLLVRHRTNWERTARRWEFLNIPLDPEGFCVMAMEIDRIQEHSEDSSVNEMELMRFSLQNIAEETLREYTKCMVFRSSMNRFVVVLNTGPEDNPSPWAESICKNIERFTKFTISVGVGGNVKDIGELPDSYVQAVQALSFHMFTEGNGALGYTQLSRTDRQAPLALEQKDELLLMLRSGNGDRAAALLADMADSLQHMTPKPHPDYVQSLYEELAAAAIRTFYELVPLPELQPLIDRYKTRRPELPLAGLEQLLQTFCREGAELVKLHHVSEGQALIYKSVDFIKSHLDREVRVSECAAWVHLSPSYYSGLFKKVTGLTVTQYVTAERIARAKEMLIGGSQVQEVANALGYEERRYFSEVFKKITGKTPSEFRESYHPEETDGRD
ncbi:response regulator [Paenibacillus sp. YN15]|uniref:response regulator n=1 Tax=Paenibacillus sp. YN15 TaxID=1742774 RepID=UPI000DCD30E9|nr:response regulator [Paenibacillus sp. YN15]RAV02426.1 DNA-binding response regulator [Paenibacillus sp. YN15]